MSPPPRLRVNPEVLRQGRGEDGVRNYPPSHPVHYTTHTVPGSRLGPDLPTARTGSLLIPEGRYRRGWVWKKSRLLPPPSFVIDGNIFRSRFQARARPSYCAGGVSADTGGDGCGRSLGFTPPPPPPPPPFPSFVFFFFFFLFFHTFHLTPL